MGIRKDASQNPANSDSDNYGDKVSPVTGLFESVSSVNLRQSAIQTSAEKNVIIEKALRQKINLMITPPNFKIGPGG